MINFNLEEGVMEGRIFICADIHGSSAVIQDIIKEINRPTPQDTIIICGDAGFEYGDHIMGKAKKAAKCFPGNWIVMRGNHDNCYWRDHTDENGNPQIGWSICEGVNGADYLVQNQYPNILYVKDTGGIYKIKDYNFLMLPGAYSVDKFYRLSVGLPYNPDEQLKLTEMYELMDIVQEWNDNNLPIDYVIGHTFPQYLEPYYSYCFMEGLDQKFIDRRTEFWLNEISFLFEVNPYFKQYYGGHFHDYRKLTDKYTMVYQDVVELGE